MGTMASQSTASWLLTQPLIQAQIKEKIKAPRHWPLCGEPAPMFSFDDIIMQIMIQAPDLAKIFYRGHPSEKNEGYIKFLHGRDFSKITAMSYTEMLFLP